MTASAEIRRRSAANVASTAERHPEHPERRSSIPRSARSVAKAHIASAASRAANASTNAVVAAHALATAETRSSIGERVYHPDHIARREAFGEVRRRRHARRYRPPERVSRVGERFAFGFRVGERIVRDDDARSSSREPRRATRTRAPTARSPRVLRATI